jgi:hypothetical protein
VTAPEPKRLVRLVALIEEELRDELRSITNGDARPNWSATVSTVIRLGLAELRRQQGRGNPL